MTGLVYIFSLHNVHQLFNLRVKRSSFRHLDIVFTTLPDGNNYDLKVSFQNVVVSLLQDRLISLIYISVKYMCSSHS